MAAKGLSDFAGLWQVSRRIADARAGREIGFSGTVGFVPDASGLLCEERGFLDVGEGAPLEALRRYRWRPDGGGAISVLFEDGAPFHRFALGDTAEAEHRCPPDLYRVVYDFRGWPRWRAVWTVTGPRKDYVSTSDYRRG